MIDSKTFKEELKELCEKHGMKSIESNLVHVDKKDQSILFINIGDSEYPATPSQVKNLKDALDGLVEVPCVIWNHTMTITKVKLDEINGMVITGNQHKTEVSEDTDEE